MTVMTPRSHFDTHNTVKIDVKKSDYYLSLAALQLVNMWRACAQSSCSNLQRCNLITFRYRLVWMHHPHSFLQLKPTILYFPRCRKYRALQFLVVQPPSGFCCCCKLTFGLLDDGMLIACFSQDLSLQCPVHFFCPFVIA